MPGRPLYRALRAERPPAVDGRVAGTVWESVPRLSAEFHLIGTGTGRSRSYLEASALHDEDALYVSFVSGPPLVPITMRNRDDALWEECAVEVFLGAGRGYYEIEVNPRAAVLDLHFPDVSEQDWRKCAVFDVAGLRWAVAETGREDRWCAQLAIPWSGVPEATRSTHEGEVCLFANLARSQTVPGGAYDLTTWSPAEKAFCELEAMGRLVLGAEAV